VKPGINICPNYAYPSLLSYPQGPTGRHSWCHNFGISEGRKGFGPASIALRTGKETASKFRSAFRPERFSEPQVGRFWQVASLLQENSRMSLTEMSRKLKVPISSLFDTLKEVEKHFHFTIV